MSRIGCASSATSFQTPMVSNNRRAAAAIAEARPWSAAPLANAGSATITLNGSPSACRKAIASASPAKPPPPIRTSARAEDALLSVLWLGGFGFGIGEVYHSIEAQNPVNPVANTAVNTAIAGLLSILDLETLEVNLFR